MLKPIEGILFATDLTSNCQPAFDYTIALATRFKATIYMLHVIEALPDRVEGRLKDLLGRHHWEDLVHNQQQNAHKSLLGKQSTNSLVREAVQNFCQQVGIEDDTCDFQSREIIISDGEVAESILRHCSENECDLIVLGTKRGLFGHSAVGSVIKTVLKNAKVPVTVVPPAKD